MTPQAPSIPPRSTTSKQLLPPSMALAHKMRVADMVADASRVAPRETPPPRGDYAITAREPSLYERTVPTKIRQAIRPRGDIAPEVWTFVKRIVDNPLEVIDGPATHAGLLSFFTKRSKAAKAAKLAKELPLAEIQANHVLLEVDPKYAADLNVFSRTESGQMSEMVWLDEMDTTLRNKWMNLGEEMRNKSDMMYEMLKNRKGPFATSDVYQSYLEEMTRQRLQAANIDLERHAIRERLERARSGLKTY